MPKAILGPLVRNFKLPPFLFNHLAATQTWAREAVPPVQPAAEGSWRLVLFSHSLTGVRFQNSALCAELASHGCVVAAVEHPYEAMLSLFADGTVAPYRFVSHLPPGLTPAGLLAFREQCVAYRADDLALVHAALLRASTKGDQHGSGDGAWPGVPQAEGGEALVLLEGLLAPRSRAAVIGHSCGGGGAALYAQRAGPERVRSALLLDGFVWWLGRARVAAGLRVPLLSLRTTKFLNDNDEFCVCATSCSTSCARRRPPRSPPCCPPRISTLPTCRPPLNHALHSDHGPVTGLIARAAGASAWRRTALGWYSTAREALSHLDAASRARPRALDSEPSADSLRVVAGAPPQPTVWYTQSELATAAAAAGEPGWSAAQLQQLERLVELARRGEPFSAEYEMPREVPLAPEELARQLACIFS